MCLSPISCFADDSKTTEVTYSQKAKVSFIDEIESKTYEYEYELDSKMVEPSHSTSTDYTFDGWYLDDYKWNFEVDTVNDNMTLQARYIKNTSKDGNVTTGIENNNDNIKEAKLDVISKSEALIIVDSFDDLKQAINNGEDVIVFVDIEKPLDDTVFESLGITSDNAVILDINLYAQIVGNDSSKKQITDTNGYKTKVSITLTPEQASKIDISSNKEYFILRNHNGTIETISASMEEVDGNYVFTFETDKFSTYAIYSKDKKVNPIIPDYVVPNTGIIGLLTGNSSSSNIFRLVFIGLLACVFVIVDKKNKNK